MRIEFKKNIILICLLFLIPFNIYSVEFEVDLSMGIGKRFSDKFDKVWPYITNDPNINAEDISAKELTYFREAASFYGTVYISPFFGHYLGLQCNLSIPYRQINVIQKINDFSHTWMVNMWALAPSFSYKIYPLSESLEDEKFYISIDAGVNIMWMDISHSYETVSEPGLEIYTFKKNIAPRFAVKSGTKYNITSYFKIFIEAGVDISRHDDLEGTADINGTVSEISLKNSSSTLLAANESSTDSFADFNTSVLWVSQVVINTGFSFVF
ncbi:MAG: hypothetical protein OEZ13_11175 [Spirochaetia bacterium]|nr:hypothetical protein [Spirochaetia bacterium]